MTALPFGMFIFGPYWIFFLLITVGLGLYAQYRISSAYAKYSGVPSRGRITGREAAAYVMQKAGVRDVAIVPIQGHLTDHYDPSKKRLALSQENYSGTSLAALGVAAHEAGHAIQHAVGYKPLKIRMSLIPVTMISSKALPFVILGGFLFGAAGGIFIDIGILCYLVLTFFHLITLPVEFDASRRAQVELAGLGIVQQDEMPGVSKTLNAAGFTYVAAFITSLLHLIQLILLRRN